jgi:hypothetical protein
MSLTSFWETLQSLTHTLPLWVYCLRTKWLHVCLFPSALVSNNFPCFSVCVALFICCSTFDLILLLSNLSPLSYRTFFWDSSFLKHVHTVVSCCFVISLNSLNFFFFSFFSISFYKRCWSRILVPVNAETVLEIMLCFCFVQCINWY